MTWKKAFVPWQKKVMTGCWTLLHPGSRRMGTVVKRFDVWLVNLDPTLGREIRKTRPCLVISPDEMNRHIARYSQYQ